MNSFLENLVPVAKQGKTAGNGRTPYEVLVFYTQSDYEYCESEKEMKRHIVAKFGCYGDAMLYAVHLKDGKMYYRIILRV